MKIQMNRLMEELFEQPSTDFMRINKPIPEALAQILTDGLRPEENTLLFRHIAPLKLDYVDEFKQTEHEYFHNTLHIDDYVNQQDNELEYVYIGLTVCKQLYALLEHQRKNPFRIQLSFKRTNYKNGSIHTYGGCTIKCFKLRQLAATAFSFEPLDDFGEEGILILEG